ncbi:hypothetical protein C8J56DRAFT_1088526, partial [Mycena floridula]
MPRPSSPTVGNPPLLRLRGGLESLLKDVHAVPVVTLKFFLHNRAPSFPAPEAKFVEVLAKMKEQKFVHRKLSSSQGLSTAATTHNLGAFLSIKALSQDILRATKQIPHPPATFEIVDRPDLAPLDTGKYSNAIPDFALHKINGPVAELLQSTYTWFDIPLAGEVRKRNNPNAEENVSEIIYYGFHILQNDPRRKFTFGFTSEDDRACFWYFSRSHICVTDKFNFVSNPKPLLDFFYRLLHASDEQLGYDHSVELVLDSNQKIQYNIALGNKFYRTVDVLSDFKADNICGRATRVWSVLELRDGKTVGDECVLKDFWLEQGSKSEKQIFDDLEGLFTETADRKIFDDYFVKILDGCRVKNSNGEDDITKGLLRTDMQPNLMSVLLTTSESDPTTTRHVHTSSEHPESAGVVPMVASGMLSLQSVQGPIQFAQRDHHRTLFEPAGSPYLCLTNITTMVTVLRDIVRALKLMWKFGLVHRDISAGNIYWNSLAKVGKLSDLEFIKSVSDMSSREIKMGTPQFMAIEIQQGMYKSRDETALQDFLRMVQDGSAMLDQSQPIDMQHPVIHNPIHDIESIFWLAVYAVTHLIPPRSSSKEAHQKIAFSIFSGLQADRNDCLYSPAAITDLLSTLDGQLQPIIDTLRYFPALLRAEYRRVEKTLPIESREFDSTHETVLKFLDFWLMTPGLKNAESLELFSILTPDPDNSNQGTDTDDLFDPTLTSSSAATGNEGARSMFQTVGVKRKRSNSRDNDVLHEE